MLAKIFTPRTKLTSLLLVLSIFGLSLSFGGVASALSGSTIASLTNTQRTSRGLVPLRWNSLLARSASLKAADMCAKNYWAHTSPDGLTPWTFIQRAGYHYITAGENLANGFTSDSAVMSAWMASAGHRANILNPKFRDIGVALRTCTIQGRNTTLVVAHYGATSTTSVSTPKPAPTVQKPAYRPAVRTTVRPVRVVKSAPRSAPKITRTTINHRPVINKKLVIKPTKTQALNLAAPPAVDISPRPKTALDIFNAFLQELSPATKQCVATYSLASCTAQAIQIYHAELRVSLYNTPFDQSIYGLRNSFSRQV